MKKIFFCLFIFAIFNAKAQSSDISVANGTVKFNSIDAYELYADNISDRGAIISLASSSAAVTTLKEVGNTSDDNVPEFLQSILNTDNIFTLGNYMVKIDVVNNRALVANSNTANVYNDLVSNNTASANVLVMNDDEQNGIEVLKAIDNGTLSFNDYKTATPEISIKWPWNRCGGADWNTDKSSPVEIWSQVNSSELNCPNNILAYGMDNKVVYQKLIFYFSLQSKIKSLKACLSSNWILVPTHNGILKLTGTARFIKVNACKSEVNLNQTDYAQETELNWRPYEGSRALSKYDFNVDFGINHITSNRVYIPSRHYRIVYGF